MVQLQETDSPSIDERLDFFEHIEEHLTEWRGADDETELIELVVEVDRHDLNYFLKHFKGYVGHPVKSDRDYEVNFLAHFDEAILDGDKPFIIVSPAVRRGTTGTPIRLESIRLGWVGLYRRPHAPHFDLRAGK